VYVAANRYQQDDFKPYLMKTSDYGKTWARIDAGIPTGAYTRVIREDPVRRGLLFAGTETGVYTSFDDGAHWQPLQLNLPRVSIRDLAIKDADLIAATHGRAFWIMDDIAPLRQVNDSIRSAPVHVFAPTTAVRWQGGRGRSGVESGENPLPGVAVDYWLKTRPKGSVKLEFLDERGAVLRTFTSPDSSAPKKDSTQLAYSAKDSLKRLTAYDTTGQSSMRKRIESDSASYLPADSVVHARVGLNRFVWNLREPGVKELKDVINDEGTTDGPMIVPGTYSVRVTADNMVRSHVFTVLDDPRIGATQAELVASYDIAKRTVTKLNALVSEVERLDEMKSQVAAASSRVKDNARVKSLSASLQARLEAIRGELADVHSQADQITLHYPVKLYNQMLNVNRMAQSFEKGPTSQGEAIFQDLSGKIDAQFNRVRTLEAGDLSAFNSLLKELGIPAVEIKPVKPIA
jgi:hypothetical protein